VTMVDSSRHPSDATHGNKNSQQESVTAPWLTMRPRRGWSFRLDRRAPWVLVGTLLVAMAVMVWNVGTGEYPIAPVDVIKTILRLETANSDYHFVVNILRLPRAIVAFVVGIMLALSGAVMQTLTRNPLASPDITGVTAGASMGAVLMILVWLSIGVATRRLTDAFDLGGYRPGCDVERHSGDFDAARRD
jgi:ABC-type enterobactin transport system permease subunit